MFKSQLRKVDLSQGSGVTKLLGEEEKMASPLAALVQGFKSFKKDATNKISEYGNSVSNGGQEKVEKERTVYELPVE